MGVYGKADLWERELRLDGEARLFCAMISLLVCDLRHPKAQLRADTQAWFSSRDFVEWCELVGLEPEAVL